MATIRPFKGLRYTPQAGSLADVISPPYDVVSPEEQRALHQRNRHNVLHLELGEARPADSDADNRYSRAAASLKAWVQSGALRPEAEPAFYLCRHSFRYGGRDYTRWEVMVQLKLEPWDTRVVLPHEHTLPEPKADRMNLLRATRTNVSPVYCLFRDPDGEMKSLLAAQASTAPVGEVPQWRDESFALWAPTDQAALDRIRQCIDGKTLYIADGHHRYETALAYRAERARSGGGADDAGYNYVFAALTRLEDPGLLVLPIHRLVRGISDDQIVALRRGLEGEWDVRSVPLKSLDQESHEHVPARFFVYGLAAGEVLVVTPRDAPRLRERVPASWPEPLRRLDLSLLHSVIIHGYLGIGREPKDVEAALGFTHDVQEAIREVDHGAYRLAILVDPTRVEEMVDVAEAGEKMPQKSTFFYPKLPTGLVLNCLDAAPS